MLSKQNTSFLVATSLAMVCSYIVVTTCSNQVRGLNLQQPSSAPNTMRACSPSRANAHALGRSRGAFDRIRVLEYGIDETKARWRSVCMTGSGTGYNNKDCIKSDFLAFAGIDRTQNPKRNLGYEGKWLRWLCVTDSIRIFFVQESTRPICSSNLVELIVLLDVGKHVVSRAHSDTRIAFS